MAELNKAQRRLLTLARTGAKVERRKTNPGPFDALVRLGFIDANGRLADAGRDRGPTYREMLGKEPECTCGRHELAAADHAAECPFRSLAPFYDH